MTTTLPYQRKSRTSKKGAEAAAEIAPTQRQRVVAFVIEHGPSTRAEISAGTGLPINVVTPRVFESLEQRDKEGKVIKYGELRRGKERACRVTTFLAEEVEYIGGPVKQGALWA